MKKRRFAGKRRYLRESIYRNRRKTLHKMQRGVCHYCGQPVPENDATIDHVIALSAGGLDVMDNYVMACEPCNRAKGSMSAEAFRAARHPLPAHAGGKG